MLVNKTTGKTIIEKTRLASTAWNRLRGLMFEKQELFDYALVFCLPREGIMPASIHMLFVFFPIDIVFLDKNKKTVDIVRGIKPFTPNYAPKNPAKFFIELPETMAKGIKLGDVLEWKSSS